MTSTVHGELLTVSETAQRLTLSEKTVRRLIDARLLPAYRVGRRAIRIDEHELTEWIYGTDESSDALSPLGASVDPAARAEAPLPARAEQPRRSAREGER